MARSAVIVREATDADLKPLEAFCRKAWDQLGTTYVADFGVARLAKMAEGGRRYFVLFDNAALVAALSGRAMKTDHGSGYEIGLFVADPKRSDRLALLDALSLYALKVAVSEGVEVIHTRRDKRMSGPVYGRDRAGMDAEHESTGHLFQVGEPKAMIAAILKRNPEWAQSL